MERVEFLASPTWSCDTSSATKGETVLLFLKKGGKSRSYAISHSGHGRMPLQNVDGKNYARLSSEVQLPKDTPTIDGPAPQPGLIRSVEVAKLRGLVKEAVDKKEKSQ
jgi:hypothetical protein